jgi:5-aminolevulinate synthase
MLYDDIFDNLLKNLKQEGRYRVFNNITRKNNEFPNAIYDKNGVKSNVVVWCSNDYLGMGQNSKVVEEFIKTVNLVGVGSGGTRNISGTSNYHVELEKEISQFHNKESSLIFTSGYIANEYSLSTLLKVLPNCVVLSDENNHASMIEGIKKGTKNKLIWKHNDVNHLEELLKTCNYDHPKIVAFESVYSMDGDFAPIEKIIEVSKKYNALTYLDEVHGVGLYGAKGGGLAQQLGLDNKIDIIEGTFAKAFGLMGGYITSNYNIIDVVRSYAPGFIFTTSIPPSLASAATSSIKYVKNNNQLRTSLFEKVNKLKKLMIDKNLPIIKNNSHIVPLLIKDPIRCKQISDILLNDYNIYSQPINYPTVPKGTERLRFTPTPLHSDYDIEFLVNSIDEIWSNLRLDR